MKIFVDTANLDEIKQAIALGICDGVTTNPTLISKEGKDFKEQILEICKIVSGPISAEVVSLDFEGMLKEARIISSWAKNLVIKIPLTEDGIKTVKTLSNEGIKTNVTLVFSVNHALLAAKAGGIYVSPFVGRLDDIGEEGMNLISDILNVYRNYHFSTQVIVASVRHPIHIVKSALLGADIVTVPFSVIKQMFKHPLTDIGIKRFLDDWQKLPTKEIK
ncbi:MAG TPA: fructose-6-phosphate aldolase [Elusimicrobia bacterium]|jgi:transaldolase|nr:fructose-6-phosphate aldolase [Elusimicrobiota bacterium]